MGLPETSRRALLKTRLPDGFHHQPVSIIPGRRHLQASSVFPCLPISRCNQWDW